MLHNMPWSALTCSNCQVDDILTHLSWLEKTCKPSCYCQDNMRDGLPSDNPEKRVDNARRLVREFWKEVFDYREYGNLATGWTCLPASLAAWGPPDVLSGNFMRRAIDFQKLVEPLDVANWYRLQAISPEEFRGEYMDRACKGRDKCFKGIDQCRERAGESKKVTEWHKVLRKVADRCKAPGQKLSAPVAPVQQECVADGK